jgi:cold shock protein
MEGIIKSWNSQKGYGFILCEGRPDVFAHISATVSREEITPGTQVEFDIEDGPRGPRAVKVREV